MSQDSPTGQFRQFTFVMNAHSLEKMRKEGQIDIRSTAGQTMLSYALACDESELLGGEDSAPPPLAYFTAAIGFCLMTQISRYAHMRKLTVNEVRLETTVHFRNEGSVLAGTIQGFVDKVETHVHITSPEDEATVQKLLADAERGCYVNQALLHPVPVENTLRHTSTTTQ